MQTNDLVRCAWAGEDPLYCRYHDEEWGRPLYDDRALYELLMLEGFQAGLSWITILRKRESFRRAFAGFLPEKVARFTPARIEKLMQDQGIVRNRAKIEATIAGARACLALMEEPGGFSGFVWEVVGGEQKRNSFRTARDVPSSSPEAERLSKKLKGRGFNFVGPTICYAFMQAAGLVDDHTLDCFRRRDA